MELIRKLQSWYESQCDGDWEHQYGIKIGTLDNPGWEVVIDLSGTDLELKSFAEISDTTGEENWKICRVKDKRFEAFCGTHQLEEVIEIFMEWSGA